MGYQNRVCVLGRGSQFCPRKEIAASSYRYGASSVGRWSCKILECLLLLLVTAEELPGGGGGRDNYLNLGLS